MEKNPQVPSVLHLAGIKITRLFTRSYSMLYTLANILKDNITTGLQNTKKKRGKSTKEFLDE